MAALTIQTIDEDGVQPAYAAAGDGDTFVNGGDVLLHVKNGSGVSVTATIPAVAGADRVVAGLGQMTKADAGGAIPAGEERMFGPFPPGAFNDSQGRATVNYSAVTTVTAGAFRLKQP